MLPSSAESQFVGNWRYHHLTATRTRIAAGIAGWPYRWLCRLTACGSMSRKQHR